MINNSLVMRSVKKLQEEINHIKENGVISSRGGGPIERKTFTIDMINDTDKHTMIPYIDDIEQLYALSDFIFSLSTENKYHNVAVHLSSPDDSIYCNSNYYLAGSNDITNSITLYFRLIEITDDYSIIIYRSDLLKGFIESGNVRDDIFIIKGSGTPPAGSDVMKTTFIIS